ncbi:hypothetical protein ACFWJ4_13760 [Kitasatospora sp. NPDC127067]
MAVPTAIMLIRAECIHGREFAAKGRLQLPGQYHTAAVGSTMPTSAT